MAADLAARIPPFFAARGFDVLAYCVMPDHVHLLLEGVTADADFRNGFRLWKLQSGHAWRQRFESPLWQIGYWERVLREEDDTRAVVRYILENPVRSGLVRQSGEYAWTGSARFSIQDLAIHAGEWHPPWKHRGQEKGQV